MFQCIFVLKQTYFNSSIPPFPSPNDLVAVGPRQFYVTNYAKYHGHGSIMAKVEMYGLIHLATVAYYDGKASTIVVEGLILANGVNKSPDGK